MEIEYASPKSSSKYAYIFTQWERQLIAYALKPEIGRLERRIKKIENDPRNEGQVRFSSKVDEINNEIKVVKSIIEEFSK